MLVSPHVTTGVALGAIIGNPIVVVPVAIASHFVLDSVPHWQETLAPYTPTWKTWVRIPIDFVIAAAIMLLAIRLLPQRAPAIVLGGLFAASPDLDVLLILFPEWKKGLLQKHWDWHCAIQRETASLWGLVPQLTVIALGIFTIYHV
jgi:hypothetical protein